MLVLAACGGATSEKTVRRLAGSPEALKARHEAELVSRDVIAVWEADTPLTLGLVVLEDVCFGGRAKELFLPTGSECRSTGSGSVRPSERRTPRHVMRATPSHTAVREAAPLRGRGVGAWSDRRGLGRLPVVE